MYKGAKFCVFLMIWVIVYQVGITFVDWEREQEIYNSVPEKGKTNKAFLVFGMGMGTLKQQIQSLGQEQEFLSLSRDLRREQETLKHLIQFFIVTLCVWH